MKKIDVNKLVYGDWVIVYGEKGSIINVNKDGDGNIVDLVLYNGKESWCVDVEEMSDEDIENEMMMGW